MSDDERAIRGLVEAWMAASKRGDTAAVLEMMTDDVVFMTPAQEPFGKAAFAAASQGMGGAKIDGASEILELQIFGTWAFIRNRIAITVTPPGGAPVHRAGYTLTILRKGDDGKWRITRDANLVTARV
jgi:uncharacterized protein (TIGR02246 family)